MLYTYIDAWLYLKISERNIALYFILLIPKEYKTILCPLSSQIAYGFAPSLKIKIFSLQTFHHHILYARHLALQKMLILCTFL